MNSLLGKCVAFTGRVPMSNSRAKTVLECAGAIVRKDVSPNVEALVVGEKPGLRMVEKAKAHGVPILKWADLRLGGRSVDLDDFILKSMDSDMASQ